MTDPQPAVAELRPRGIGELLDAAFKATRRHFKAMALCALVVALPAAVFNTLVELSTSSDAYDFTTETTTYNSTGAFVGGLLLQSAAGLVAGVLVTAACLQIVGSDLLGGRTNAGASLRAAATRFGPLFAVSLLFGVLTLLGFVALVIPGIWFAIAGALAVPALFYERLGPWAAIKRSVGLVRGNWLRVFGTLLVIYLLLTVLVFVVAFAIGALVLVDSANETVNAIVLTAVEVAANTIVLPLGAAATALLYFDARVRKEGLDIELQAGRITGGAAPSGAAGAPADEGFLPPAAR